MDLRIKAPEVIGQAIAPGFPGIFVSRLGPLALDNAKRKLDPTLFSIAVDGLSQKQIDEAALAAASGFARLRSALRAAFLRFG
jgi:hypothetical protein